MNPQIPFKPAPLHWGGHLQSIIPSLYSVAPQPAWQRSRWEWNDAIEATIVPQDGDFVDIDSLPQGDVSAPTLVLFHGLEGSSNSHYSRSIAAFFHAQGWRVLAPHFRGCSGVPNRLLRAYHSGDSAEIARMLLRASRLYPQSPLHALGVSLGGNALLCYLAEHGQEQWQGAPVPHKAMAVCAPLDLGRCGEAITTGFANVYTMMFMKTLLQKTREKKPKFPEAVEWDTVLKCKNLAEFDEVFTGPVHGYAGVLDYYARASAKEKLPHIKTPTLMINARNDPFVPNDILDAIEKRQLCSPSTTLERPDYGGHVGFASGTAKHLLRGELQWLPRRAWAFFNETAAN